MKIYRSNCKLKIIQKQIIKNDLPIPHVFGQGFIYIYIYIYI